jgi:hypothetical protein
LVYIDTGKWQEVTLTVDFCYDYVDFADWYEPGCGGVILIPRFLIDVENIADVEILLIPPKSRFRHFRMQQKQKKMEQTINKSICRFCLFVNTNKSKANI